MAIRGAVTRGLPSWLTDGKQALTFAQGDAESLQPAQQTALQEGQQADDSTDTPQEGKAE